jgi:hypothetical protein
MIIVSDVIGECTSMNDGVILDINDSEDESGVVEIRADIGDSDILSTSVPAFGKYWHSGKVDSAAELILSLFFWLCVLRTCTNSVVHTVEVGSGIDTEHVLVDSKLETADCGAMQVEVDLVEVCSCTIDTHVELDFKIETSL